MFKDFQQAVSKQFDRMKKHDLFRVQVEKDQLWETYLGSFPDGTNPIYKERTEHDCQCCKSFVRAVGGMVAIIDGNPESVWDTKVDGFYQEVADKMAALVRSKPIKNIFLHTEPTAGVKENYQEKDDGRVQTWNHFFIQLPTNRVAKGELIGPSLSDTRATRDVFHRSLTELTDESINTVLDLIAQNSLYRGEEQKFALEEFRKLKKKYDHLVGDAARDIFCWSGPKGVSTSVARIRNTAIGTLLTDLSLGEDLESAVKSFEAKVAPANYKRPTALITKAMIAKAQETIQELGLGSALERRYAHLQDITINNILFADRKTKKSLTGDVFDELSAKVPEKLKNFDKVETVTIEKFLEDILPKADSIEVMFENRHASNLVSLIAPVDQTSKELFKWPNKFSWSYAGELADSIKERVKAAGGKVDGDLRCSLSWFNFDDLDLHMKEPGGYTIYYGNRGRASPSRGKLDVDMNAGCGTTRSAVENICYLDRKHMRDGVYTLLVNNFSPRETIDVGFEVEIEVDGNIHSIGYARAVRRGDLVEVAKIKYSAKDGFEIFPSLPASQTVKEVWGLPTQSFHKVNVVMLSPNHWDGRAVGNKHYFFMLEGCLNDCKARGFFNEFLTEELNQHRKVFEVVGSKMKTEESIDQLSGLGFSSTQRNSVLCRVKGSFNRVVKVTF